MNRRHAFSFFLATLAGLSARAASAAPCESLASLKLSQTTITAANMVAPGEFTPPGVPPTGPTLAAYRSLPGFCRVLGVIQPSNDSHIEFEVWLPVSGWNGKFQMVGNGGFAGTIAYGGGAGGIELGMAQALKSGYATASTDTGHVGNNGEFILGHPERLVDFAYRSIHETTVQGKAIVATYYGTPAKFAYYNGCSTGGRQSLAEAQKYPQDFNGIIAGAASWDQMRLDGARLVLNVLLNRDQSVIPASKYPMIHEAVVNACDALDGVNDGLIENPMACEFDYSKLACANGDGANCLTSEQVSSAKALTSPLKDPKTGRMLFEGYLMPGSELGWSALAGPEPTAGFVSSLQNITFHDPQWDYRTIDISTDVDRAAKSDNELLYQGEPNLKPFFTQGGKLLMYHGWSDPRITPLNSVRYYEAVLQAVGKNNAANSIALFMAPGVAHCGGGDGPNAFNPVSILDEWVQSGKTPEKIIAAHITDGKADRTRPLCPYPQQAHYKGSGSTDDAANFVCKAP